MSELLTAQQAPHSCAADLWQLSKLEMKLGLKIYSLGDLHYKPFTQKDGLYGFSVYRGKKLILHKAAKGDHIYSLWISFAHNQRRSKSVHSFDGDIDDFLTLNGGTGTNPLVDLNGDGEPDIIVADADTHRTTAYAIYSLGNPVKRIAHVEGSYPCMRFMDIDHNGEFEALTWDHTFRYWCESGARSPTPLVILKFGKNKFELATSLMRTIPPSKSRQEQILADWSHACAKDTRKSDEFYLSSDVWRDMLYLIYSGNSRVAFGLLDKLWKPGTFATNVMDGHTSKEMFMRGFLRRLNESPYIKGIRELNPGDQHLGTFRKDRGDTLKNQTIFLIRDCS